jgi:hypothetical protein
MPVLEYNKLSLGAKNSTVDAFRILVEESLGASTESDKKDVLSILPHKYESELDKELYDKAVSLPEYKTVSFKFLDNKSDIRYGVFKGKNIYKDFNGTIDSSNKGTGNQIGWLILDRSSDIYCLFVNYGSSSSIIISIDDFEVQQIVEDFSPLYDKLKERKYEFDESFINDTHLSTSLAVSMKDTIADILSERKNDNDTSAFKATSSGEKGSTSWDKLPTGEITIRDKLFNIWKMYMAAYMAWGEFSLLIQRIENGEFLQDARSFTIFPVSKHTNPIDNRKVSDFSKLSVVQAIVYDIPEYFGTTDGKSGTKKAHNMLLCFQQPESVSYTAASSYESISPRGSQVPYQYYQNANQIEITFELKWHIDELRAVSDDLTLEDIERMAESFQRPWETESGSLMPKVCGVILPGISRVGYISSVSITYGGSMTGKYANGDFSAVRDSNYQLKSDNVNEFCTEYYYSELTVSFTMILLEDVQLQKTTGDFSEKEAAAELKNSLSRANRLAENLSVKAADDNEDPLAMMQKIANGAAMALEAAGGLADASAQMAKAASDFMSSII